MNKYFIGFVSPIAIIVICSISTILLNNVIGKWIFIPVFILYWGLSFFITVKFAGFSSMKNWFQKPKGKAGWLILSIFIGFIPFSIFFCSIKFPKKYFITLSR